MEKKYIFLVCICVASFCLSGCNSDLDDYKAGSSSGTDVEVSEASEDDYVENSTFTQVVYIHFSGSSASVVNEVSGVSVSQSGAAVIVSSTVKEVEYILSGTTTEGSFKLYSDYKCKLSLNGVDITSVSGPAINIQSGKRIFVVLEEGSDNYLTDSSSYPSSSEDQKAAFFSEGQLLFSGSGSLTVKGNYKHAICSDDYIFIREGVCIAVTGTVKDGFHCNDYFLMEGGTLDICSSDEGICCEEGSVVIHDGDITIETNGTSAKGIKGVGNVTINGGEIRITASGKGSCEGIESKNILTINGGLIEVNAYDDGLNASKAININGGTIYSYSTNNDGIDSNGTLSISGGLVIACGTTQPEDGIDCDNNTFAITGGTVLGVGGGSSTPTSSVCTQPSVIYGGSGSSGDLFHIAADDGTGILTFRLPRSYSQMTVLYSGPALKTNQSYTICSGGTSAGGTDYYGYITDNTYSGGTTLYTFTVASMVTQVGSSSGSGGSNPGGSGRPGGGW